MSALKYTVPTSEEVIRDVREKFGKTPCKFQVEATIAQLSREKEDLYRHAVVCVAGMGSGKSLCFFIPFIFNKGGISIMVTPLIVLAKQMALYASKLDITVANLTGDAANDKLIKVRIPLWSLLKTCLHA